MLESDGPGGAENMVLHLAEELRRRGHAIVPVGPSTGCGWLAEEFRVRGFEPASFTLRRAVDWECLRGLATLFRRHQVNIVHSHDFTMAVYGAAAARVARAAHIITMHGGRHYAKRWRRRVALKWAMQTSQGVVAVSRATGQDIETVLRLQSGSIDTIANGISFEPGHPDPVRSELGLAPNEMLLLAVGNLYPVKGHAVLLEAFAMLQASETLPDSRLAIAGAGVEAPRLRELAKHRGLNDKVHFLGHRADVPDLLAAADVFVLPSLAEGLPLALIEAMFAGKAIAASNVGGIADALQHGKEGLLVPSGDAAGLADCMRRLISDRGCRTQLGRAANARARADYTVERMVDGYERLYGLGGRGGARSQGRGKAW